ncbi:MDR family MFS transporter [Williamsia maris]|uniref:Drug resistance transporter, EmrB/QacA subfamily n=1 Tax=Williamsia maris TaxID=72806 RepID=A0ABT1HEF5_9NOCA|nr:MDR family MFS transporter [Williamsia maris]MCP2176632.1 drug resistance transporter, EmrB/QacA subfamily [Williamsia maris]
MSSDAAVSRGAATAVASDKDPGGLTHRQILTIMGGLMIGMFLAALDQTIVSTAIRTIADDLHGYSLQAWVTTAYLITSTIVTPLYGKLSDMYGRKPFFMTAITLFIIGSLLCSTATSMYELAGYRALQGLGAGGLFSLALTIIGDIVPPRERAKYQGYFLAVFGTSSVLGPVLGGLFAGQSSILFITGWRWVFLVNVPIGLIALVVVFKVLDYNQIKGERRRLDWWGALALALGVVPLLIAAEQGREWGWGDYKTIVCYIVGVLGIAAFISVEKAMGEAAIIPLRVFKNRIFSQGIVISVVIGAVMFGAISILPQYFQVIRGSSPTVAGLQLLPMVVGLMSASILSGQTISRTGRYKIFPMIGVVLITVVTFLMHYVSVGTPLWLVMVMAFFLGFGLGNLMQPLTLAMQNVLPAKDMGISTSSATFFRQIGGTLGVAVFFSVLFSAMGPNIADQIEKAAPTAEFKQGVAEAARSGDATVAQFGQGLASGNPGASSSVLNDTSFIPKLPSAVAEPLKVGFADSMDLVFLSVSIMSIIALVAVFTWKEVPLRGSSGSQAAAQDLADEKALNDTNSGGSVVAGDVSVADSIAEATPAPDHGRHEVDTGGPGRHEVGRAPGADNVPPLGGSEENPGRHEA